MGTHQGNKLTCNSSGNVFPQLSQLAEILLTDPGLKSGIGVHELISSQRNKLNYFFKIKYRWGLICQTFPRTLCMWGNSMPPTYNQEAKQSYTDDNVHAQEDQEVARERSVTTSWSSAASATCPRVTYCERKWHLAPSRASDSTPSWRKGTSFHW